MLTLVPLGGLCNRLRVVLSALQLATQTNGGITIEWASNKECQAFFNELFLPIDTGRLHINKCHWWAKPARKRNAMWPAILRTILGYTLQRESYVPLSEEDLFYILGKKSKTYISTGSQLIPYTRAAITRIVPQPDIQRTIDRIISHYSRTMIGVHIRQTDNIKAQQKSTLNAFRKAIDNEITKNLNVKFFLATDSYSVKKQLLQEYPDRFITQQAQLRRDTLEGMKQATVDLFCLAATQRIIGSYWSSFTDTAAEIGNIPLKIAE